MLLLVTAGTFALGTAIVLAIYYSVTAESPVTERLRQIFPESGAASSARSARPADASVPRRLLAVLGRYGLSRGDSSLAQRLSAADLRGPNALALFVGARTLISFGPALLILVRQVSSGKPLAGALWTALLVWGIGHVLANLWLRRRVKWRTRMIDEGLADSLDLMVICLEAGLGLNATIARVGQERAVLDDPLGRELAQVTFELRSGRSREEALRALADRNGVDDLKALTALIIQSDKLGASMAKTLRVHADLVRTRRRQRAEEAARKLPIKVLLPLATLLLPALFIIAVGPAFLRLKDLAGMFTGGH